MNKKILIASIFATLMLITILSAVFTANAVSIEEETLSTNTEPAGASIYAYLYGRIENLDKDDMFEVSFDAVNLRIISLVPFGFYHLNSGEEVIIDCFAPYMFAILGILTDFIVFALCGNVYW